MKAKRGTGGPGGKRSGQAEEGEGLNDSQTRSLAVVLRHVEETVDGLEVCLTQDEGEHVFYRLRNPYTPAERRQFREIAAGFRQRLRHCRERWALPAQTRRLDMEVAAAAAVLWSDLEDSRPAKLRRYGEVPQGLRASLQADIDELSALVVQLGQIGR